MHPQHFSLELLKNLIESAPTAFPQAKKEEMLKAYKTLAANFSAGGEEINHRMIEFGKEIWPYRQALQKMYQSEGKTKEDALIRDILPPELLHKFLEFIRNGGSLEDFRQGAVLETIFTPEEKFILGQAMLKAHEQVMRELNEASLKEKQDDFAAWVQEFEDLKKQMMEKIAVLKEMARTSSKWKSEIEDKIKTLEESFALVERGYNINDVEETIDYYRGVMTETEQEY